jgi:hypothetical protein
METVTGLLLGPSAGDGDFLWEKSMLQRQGAFNFFQYNESNVHLPE